MEEGLGVEAAGGVVGLEVEVGLGVEEAGGIAVISRGLGVDVLDGENVGDSGTHAIRTTKIKHRKRFFSIQLTHDFPAMSWCNDE